MIVQYTEALDAARSGKWETVGLKAGKICEIVYSILQGHVSGAFPKKPAKPKNMVDACNALTKADQNAFSRSVRLQIPRVICAVYELRNNRDIGHVGGDVDPNTMDGQLFLRNIKWLISEIVRLFHQVGAEEANAIIESITARSNPVIWESGQKIRVLDAGMVAKDKVLLILYHSAQAMPEAQIRENVEYANPTNFRKLVLTPLHRKKLIEFDRKSGNAEILPPGVDRVETVLLK